MFYRLYLRFLMWAKTRQYNRLNDNAESRIHFLKSYSPHLLGLYNETYGLFVNGEFGFDTVDEFLYCIDQAGRYIGALHSVPDSSLPKIASNNKLLKTYLRTQINGHDVPLSIAIKEVCSEFEELLEAVNNIENTAFKSYAQRVVKALDSELAVLVHVLHNAMVYSYVRKSKPNAEKHR